jgi:glycosyltransferase 2 family protein
MSKSKKNPRVGFLVNFALALLAFGLLGFVIWQNRVAIRGVFSKPLDLKLLALAAAVYLVAMFGTFVRWFFLVRVIEPKFKFSATVLLGLIGMVFNLVIPGAVGGDLIKAAYLARMRIRKTQAIASMVIDRIVGLLGLFILASIAGAFAWELATTDVRKLIMAAWLAVAAGLLVLFVIFSQVLTRIFPQLTRGHSRLSLIVSELSEMSTTYRGRLGVVVGAAAISVCTHGLNVVAFYLVGRMLFPDMPTTLAEHFLMVPLTLFSMAVPLPFGALGLSEEVGQELFKLVRHPSGALAMMGFRVLMYAGAGIGACVYLWNLKEIRELTASAHEIEEEMLDGELDEDDSTTDKNEPDRESGEAASPS